MIYLFIYLIAQPKGPSRATDAAATLATTQRQRSLSAARPRNTSRHLPFFQCNQCGFAIPRRCQQIPLQPSRTTCRTHPSFGAPCLRTAPSSSPYPTAPLTPASHTRPLTPTATAPSRHNLRNPQKARLAAPSRLSTSPAIPPSGPTSLPRYITAPALSISFPPTQRDPGPTP